MQAGTGGRAPFTMGGSAPPATTGGTATQGGKAALFVGGMMSTTIGGRATVVVGPGAFPSTVTFPAAAPAPFATSPVLCRTPVPWGSTVTPPKMRSKMSPSRSTRAVPPELHSTSTTMHSAAAAAAD